MEKVNHYKTISQLHQASNYLPPVHPLMSMVTCSDLVSCSLGESRFSSDFYMIGFKKIKSGHLLYGKTKYDHDNGSMMFAKPRQIIEFSNVQFEERSFVIFIHEDYLAGHPLHDLIRKYGFFEYEINEALHLSPSEEQIMWDLYEKIKVEYNNNPDEFSREIILSHVDSLLKYSDRFYKRQFINRSANVSGTTIKRFQSLLDHYFENGRMKKRRIAYGESSGNGIESFFALPERCTESGNRQDRPGAHSSVPRR